MRERGSHLTRLPIALATAASLGQTMPLPLLGSEVDLPIPTSCQTFGDVSPAAAAAAADTEGLRVYGWEDGEELPVAFEFVVVRTGLVVVVGRAGGSI